jgi:cardiolipin synthase
MHFDSDDYFLYYNEIGEFEARLLMQKPADYSVAERFNFSQFILRARPKLMGFLRAEGVTARQIVFSTGDAGAYSLPFLYIDIDLPLAVFVRYAPAPKSRRTAVPGTPMVQSMGHITHSHTSGLAIRPLSSVFRLLFAAGDVAVETVRPNWLVTLESQPIPEVADVPAMDLSEWEQQLDKLTGRPAVKGTIDYLINGGEYFTRLIDAITSARESILIRTYIFDNDDYAEKIGQLLRRRSQEGIEVKILLDGLGKIMATGVDDTSMPADHQAPESVRNFLEQDSDIQVRQVRNPWLTGDHVKTTIIDGEYAFTGGMNIGREYRYEWHDIMMEVRGPVVDTLIEDFYDAWVHAGPFGDIGYLFHQLLREGEPTEDIGYPVRVLFTRPGDAEIFRAQLAAIRNAQRYIYIQNAYFTDDAMLYELARARRQGVDVRVILPLVGNHGPINQSHVLAANAMLEHGIRVFLYPGMSHAKAAVFDGWACIGSANWDKLSFRTNMEFNLATSHPPAVAELLDRLFAEDFSKSVELTEPFPASWSDYLYEVVADYLL